MDGQVLSTEDSLSKLLRKVGSNQETVFDIAEKDGVRRVEVVRRKALPEVRKADLPLARDNARAYEFHSLDAFASFIDRECEASDTILADVDSQSITAVIHEKEGTGRETITFVAKTHPLFKPWLEILNKPVPVLEFALFAQRYRRSIKKPDGREVAMVFSQIRISKAIEINKGVGAKALNGVMIHTEIAGAKKDVLVELPEEITLNCPVFVESPEQEIVLDVLVTDGRDGVVVYLTSPILDEVRIEAFSSMVDQLQRDCPELLIGLGKTAFRDWKTVSQS